MHSEIKRQIFNLSHWISLEELCCLLGPDNMLASSKLADWESARDLFAIIYDNQIYYPKYGFDENWVLLPAFKDILKLFEGEKSAWAIAAWFASANGWLNGGTPQTQLRVHPDQVLHAAKMEAYPSEHG